MKNEGIFSKLQDKVAADVSSTTDRLLRATTEASKPKKPTPRETTTPRHHDTVISPNQAIETIRKAVKEQGLLAATHRFTKEEKNALAEVVYTYNRQGLKKTSENEIVRIGIHHLLKDYKDNGKDSVLAKVLAALQS